VGKRKNKVEKVGVFFEAKKCPSTHHDYHAFHHDLTIRTPRSAHRFCKNPLQKHKSASAKKLSFY
jgi:hypothetical protein